jgi:hypothetical protein
VEEGRYAEARTSSAVVAAVCVGGFISTSLQHMRRWVVGT